MRSRVGRVLALGLPAAVLLAVPQAGMCQGKASDYLEKIARSAKGTYQSRQLVVYLGAPQSAAVVEVRSSPTGTFVRAEAPGTVTRAWSDPGHALISGEHLAFEDFGRRTVSVDPGPLVKKYDVQVQPQSTLLGVDVVPLDLVRRRDHRLVERLWVQPDNGVVYRREVFGAKGMLLGMSTVLDMRWGQSEPSEPYRGATPTRVRSGEKIPGAPKSLPYGYTLDAAYKVPAKGRSATQWVYTDGLHALSVFKLAGTMRRPARAYRTVALESTKAWVGPGPGTWIWQGGRSTWVVVADESQLDPAVITAALPQGGPPTLSRMGSWWAGAYHWLRSKL